MVLEAPRGGDKHINAVAQRTALFAVADPAENGADFQVGEPGEVAHRCFDLHGQFPGRLKHEAAEFAVVAESLQGGQGERGGFTRTGLGGCYDIAAFEGRGDRPELDWGWLPVAHGLDAFE